ncbi:hypothetical protein LC605_19085 [Nostoc sp. CHAB 5836]|nr:hypothetical protein [Nostoc sp. CHAB 5836]
MTNDSFSQLALFASLYLLWQFPETLRLGAASLFQLIVIVNHSRLYI